MDKKTISEHLIDALNKEDLPRREAARFLNLNPRYVTMAQNPKSWDAMGRAAWERMEAWHETRQKISEFKIPDGEEIWKPKEKDQEAPKRDVVKHKEGEQTRIAEAVLKKLEEEKDLEEHSPENLDMFDQIGKINRGADFIVKEVLPPPGDHFTDTARLKVALDIEINLVINGQKVNLR